MKFIEKIKSSINGPKYYSEILSKPFSYSFKYFLSLMVLIALIATIAFSISTFPEMNKSIAEVGPGVSNYYPDGLEITVKGGKVSTNVKEPYFIKAPVEFQEENISSEEAVENLLVIDTGSSMSLDLFREYDTAVLLGRDSVTYLDSGTIKIQPLGQDLDGVVTKAKVIVAVQKIMPYIKILPIIIVPIIFICFLFASILKYLIYLIFGAFLIWLMFKIKKINIKYGKSYQIGLHAITLGVILEATVFWIFPNLEIPLFFTIVMLLVISANFKSLPIKNNPVVEAKSTI